MKKLAIAAVLAASFAAPVKAGALSDPVIEAPVIVEDATSSSSQSTLVLLVLATVIGAIVAAH